MNHLLNVLGGVAGVLVCAGQQRQYSSENQGFLHDQKTLRRDFENVGNDIKSELRKYGESITSKSYKQER